MTRLLRVLLALAPPLAEALVRYLERREARRRQAAALEVERLRLLALAEAQRRRASDKRLTEESAAAMTERLRALRERR